MFGLVNVVFVCRSSLKMVALVLTCTVVEQQAVIIFVGGSESVKTSEILKSELQPVICNKRRGFLSKGFFCFMIACIQISRQLSLNQFGS